MPVLYPYITHHGRRILSYLPCNKPLVGCEVGVWRGKNAATLLARAPLLRLYCCDFWGDPNGTTTGDQSLQTGDDVCREALAETSFAADRRIIVRCKSPEAAALVTEPLDFVLVDGDHAYAPCLADLRAWWPLLKPGGYLFSHDWRNPQSFAAEWGVERACAEFAAEVGCEVVGHEWPEMLGVIRKPL